MGEEIKETYISIERIQANIEAIGTDPSFTTVSLIARHRIHNLEARLNKSENSSDYVTVPATA